MARWLVGRIGVLTAVIALVSACITLQGHDRYAGARLYSLDNATLDRVERVYRDGMAGHEAFENQAARWQRDHPGAEGLTDLAERVSRLRPAYQRVLDLAHQQRSNTTEALMSKSDFEVGLEALFGDRKW